MLFGRYNREVKRPRKLRAPSGFETENKLQEM